MRRVVGLRRCSERPLPRGTDERLAGDTDDTDPRSAKRRHRGRCFQHQEAIDALAGGQPARGDQPSEARNRLDAADRLSRPAARRCATSGFDLDRRGLVPCREHLLRDSAGSVASAAHGNWLVRGPTAAAARRKQLLVIECTGCAARLYRVSRGHSASSRGAACIADERCPAWLHSRRRCGGVGPADMRARLRHHHPRVARYPMGRQPGGAYAADPAGARRAGEQCRAHLRIFCDGCADLGRC